MKKIFAMAAAVCLTVAAFSSCAAVIPTRAGIGTLYTDVSEMEAVTGNNLGSKVGTAQSINVLGAVNLGDASVQEAAKKAGIRKISHVDCKKTSILGIFSTYTVYVYGE